MKRWSVVFLVLGGTGLQAEAQKPLPPAPVPCTFVQVSALEASPGAKNRFSATAVTDLVFTTRFAGKLSGEHVLELKVFAPSGALYQSLAVPIAEPGKQPGARPVKGYPYPKEEVAVRTVGQGMAAVHEVDVSFPVGGTLILQNGLYGTWSVEPYLDFQRRACGPTTSFEIVP